MWFKRKLFDTPGGSSDLVGSTIVRMLSNQTTTLDTNVAITDLVFAAEASKSYILRGFIRTGCSGTGGIKYSVTVPAGATFDGHIYGFTTAAAGFEISLMQNSGTLSAKAYNAIVNQSYGVLLEITVNISTTAGNIQFGFASTTAGQTSTLYSKSTYIEVIPLS